MDNNREVQLREIGIQVQKMVAPYAKLAIVYRKETEELLNRFTDWERQRFGMLSGDEHFLIYRGDELLYVVCVNADSILTAASELINLIARKF